MKKVLNSDEYSVYQDSSKHSYRDYSEAAVQIYFFKNFPKNTGCRVLLLVKFQGDCSITGVLLEIFENIDIS